MLLFLIKHSQPDIANTVRQEELTTVLDGPSPAAYKEGWKRVMKYVLDTEKLTLKIQQKWRMGRENDPWLFTQTVTMPQTRTTECPFHVLYCTCVVYP
jgi:hypothetical protein